LTHREIMTLRPVCTENLNPTIMVMKSAKDGA
jgi:hypothetical protein